jgi:hypothetical protein
MWLWMLELHLRLAAAIVLCVSLGVVSYWGSARLLGAGSPLARACATSIIGLAIASVAFHLAIPLGLFTLPVAIVGGLVLAGVVIHSSEARHLIMRAAAVDWRAIRRVRRLLGSSGGRAWVTVYAVAAVPVVVRPFVTPAVAWDFIMYHGVKAALWVQNGGGPGLNLDHGPSSWELTRTTFAGGEVFLAWAMLPMHCDFLVGASQVAQWLALGLALIFLARQIGVREPFATIAAGFVLALAPIRLQVGSGYVEIPLALTLVTAMAFALQALRQGGAAPKLLCAAAIGLACAIKITSLPVAAIVLIFLLVVAVRGREWRTIAAGAAVFVALASPWMIYNAIDTGAPLSPASIEVLGIELGKDSEAMERMHEHPERRPRTFANERKAFNTTFTDLSAYREAIGWPVLVPLGMLLISLPILARRSWQASLLLALVIGASLAVAYSPQMWLWRLILKENFSRFLVPAVVIAVPASMAWCDRRYFLARVYGAFLLIVAFFVLLRYTLVGVAIHEIGDMLRFMVGLCALFLVALAARRLRSRHWRVAVVTVAALLLLAQTRERRDEHRVASMRSSHFLHGVYRYWVDAAAIVEKPGKRIRISVTHGVANFLDTGLFYFLLGSKLQNQLVYVPPSRDGSTVFDPTKDTGSMSFDSWLERLRAAGIDYVVSIDPPTVELEWMEKHPRVFRRLAGVPGLRGIFQLLPSDTEAVGRATSAAKAAPAH